MLLPVSAGLAVVSYFSNDPLPLTASLAVLGLFLAGKVAAVSRK
jgi:hypothetical protein